LHKVVQQQATGDVQEYYHTQNITQNVSSALQSSTFLTQGVCTHISGNLTKINFIIAEKP